MGSLSSTNLLRASFCGLAEGSGDMIYFVDMLENKQDLQGDILGLFFCQRLFLPELLNFDSPDTADGDRLVFVPGLKSFDLALPASI